MTRKSFIYTLFFVLFFMGAITCLHAEQVLFKVSTVLSKKSADQVLSGIGNVDRVLSTFSAYSARQLFDTSETSLGSPLSQWMTTSVPDGTAIDDLVSELEKLPNVLAAQPNRVFHLDNVPNDPRLSEQWALEKIQATRAWDIEQGERDVLVAIIDTGVEYYHSDLLDNVWVNPGEDLNGNGVVDFSDYNGLDDDNNGFVDDLMGWDFTDAPNYPDGGDYLSRDNDPMDEMGHGTGVAGIVAAVTNNQTGIAGAAPNCRVMALRAFTSGGNGEEDDVASAMLYAVHNGARVINMSWGDVFVTRLIEDMVKYAASKGVVMVASAGNASTDQVHYPSGFPETVSVGSTDDEDDLSGFSNYGALVDLVAPGSDILTTDLDNEYSTMNGTSFAAPFVSAGAALLLSKQPQLLPDAVKGRLINSTDDLGDPGNDPYYRGGRLNLYNLVQSDVGAVAKIDTPYLDAGINQGPVEIYGSAWSASLNEYTLMYGKGPNPLEWTIITSVQGTRVLDGYLGTWQDLPQDEGEYSLKVVVQDRSGKETEGVTRVFIDRSAPEITNAELLPMLDGSKHAVLVQYNTDDLCEGSVFYRENNSNQDFVEAPLDYRTRDLRYLLSQSEAMQELQVKLRAVNGAGLVTVDDNSGSYYQANLDLDPVSSSRYTPINLLLPFGHLLNNSFDYNNNGLPELVLSADDQGSIGHIQFWEYNGSIMEQVAEIENDLIPRDMADINGDGVPELLCGFGFSSYIYSTDGSNQFPLSVLHDFEGTSAQQYWASRFADLDKDGKAEVILRVVDTNTDQFEVWEWSGTDFESVASFQNTSSGENMNGVPHVEIGDFDNDGMMDVLIADNDGDLLVYENTGDNSYDLTWKYSLPLLDAIDFIRAGDFDGDGHPEFAAGCHSDPNLNSEHEYDARHWYYAVFDQNGDNTYAIQADWRFFGHESVRDFPSGISRGDLNADNDDELVVCVFPDMYVIDYDQEQGYTPVYHFETAMSNSAIITDADGDGVTEFFAGNGEYTRSFQMTGGAAGPAVPSGFSARPQDEQTVLLSWRGVKDADEYIVYRGADPFQLVPVTRTSETDWTDTNIVSGNLYWYAVQTISSLYTPDASLQSALVSARPGARPAVDKAVAESNSSIRVWFNEAMNASAKVPSAYELEGMGRPSSAVIDESGEKVVLAWNKPFPREGDYTLSCKGLSDADNTPMDTTRNMATVNIVFSKSVPYLVEGTLEENLLHLTFSEAMDPVSVQKAENYSTSSDISITSATLYDNRYVKLETSSNVSLGALGKSLDVYVKNVTSVQGIAMKEGRGDMLRLIFSASDLSNVFTFPNPWRPGLGVEGITFGNLTQSAEIRIMTETGLHVRTLYEDNGDGGTVWDLKNENGDPVASGIYIYRVKNDVQYTQGKLAIVK